MIDRKSPEHILVAGNMGYVGPAVVRHLRERFPSARLTGLDTGYFAHCLTSPSPLPECRLDTQSFRDVRDVTPADLEGVDAVVNLAAISNDPMGKAFEAQTEAINHRAGVRLARLAKAAGVGRFVFASSCSIYGFAEGRPRVESDPLNPLTAYARSKVATEQALAELADDGFHATCLRFPTACGMSERLRLDLVLNDFVAGAISGGRIEILSDGSPWRPLIDTNDMALAIEWALGRPASAGGAYLAINAGRNESNHQIRDLATAVAAVIPGVSVDIAEDASPDKRSYQVDFTRYRELAPDHLPRYTLTDSIVALERGLTKIAFADADFRRASLIRLNVLRALVDSGALDGRLRWTRGGEDVEMSHSRARRAQPTADERPAFAREH